MLSNKIIKIVRIIRIFDHNFSWIRFLPWWSDKEYSDTVRSKWQLHDLFHWGNAFTALWYPPCLFSKYKRNYQLNPELARHSISCRPLLSQYLKSNKYLLDWGLSWSMKEIWASDTPISLLKMVLAANKSSRPFLKWIPDQLCLKLK